MARKPGHSENQSESLCLPLFDCSRHQEVVGRERPRKKGPALALADAGSAPESRTCG